jgi:uncharacterized damage-inducible protein DinB
MRAPELLLYAYDQVEEVFRAAVSGLSGEQLAVRLDPQANSIAWLAWHLTRVQDDHVADVAGREQVYTAQGFARRFDLPFDDAAIGYGFSAEDVGRVRVESADLLLEYHAAAHAQTADFLRGLSEDDLDRVVDERWDPPVTLGVRLFSVVGDDLQHAGQAAYVRGLLERRD